jgi:hypothetical protein
MKSVGYVFSIISVLLLVAATWKNVSEEPLFLLFLIGGAITSIIGMCLRWASYRRERV